jgi:hypothetical protein
MLTRLAPNLPRRYVVPFSPQRTGGCVLHRALATVRGKLVMDGMAEWQNRPLDRGASPVRAAGR